MKTIGMEETTLDACLEEARRERVVITRDGVPIALLVGLGGIDEEQARSGTSDRFWELIRDRRQQDTLDRASLEQELDSGGATVDEGPGEMRGWVAGAETSCPICQVL